MKRILSMLALLALAGPSFAGNYVGDYVLGDTVYCKFGTVRPSTGASFTLAGSPVISAYPDNSTTQITAGITLTVDFDSVTGMNNLAVVASGGNGYAAGTFYSLQITTGTVDSISVTGQEVCSFSLTKTSALRPTTATRTLDVASTGEAGLDITNVIACTGPVPALGIIDCGTAQSVTGTTLVLRSAANFDADSEIIGATCVIGTATTGAGQARTVTAYVNSTDTATVATWTTTPTGPITYTCFGTSSSTGTVSIGTGGITNASFASGAIDATAIATDAITSSEVAATAATEIGDAAWASTTRVLTAATNLTTALATPTNITAGTITTVTNLTNAPTAGDLTATMKTSVGTAVATAQGLLTGTCSSGSTTTCVDAALTQANASQLQDRLICFSDAWCGLITTFNPATDTATTTKIAPATRASLTYIIFPSTTQ